MLLNINGKFTMGKLKSSNLSKVYLNHVMIKIIKKYAGVDGMLLNRNGKFTMGKLKSPLCHKVTIKYNSNIIHISYN
jgi:hypothetical protein